MEKAVLFINMTSIRTTKRRGALVNADAFSRSLSPRERDGERGKELSKLRSVSSRSRVLANATASFFWSACLLTTSLGSAQDLSNKLPGWISSVAFSPDARSVASGGSDNVARIRNANTGEETAVLEGHADYVAAVAFAPEGRSLATGSYDHTVRIWDLASRQTRHVLKGHRGVVMSVAFSPDGKLLATASLDSTVKLWSTGTGRLRGTLRGHKSWVNSVVFAPNGSILVSGSSDGTIKLWDVRSRRSKATLQATDAEIRSVAISSDGKMIAAGIRYGTIKLWLNQKPLVDFKAHESDVWSITFTPDGSKLISGDGDWNKPGKVKFWDAHSGKLLGSFEHSGEVLSVACSPEGTRFAAGGWDRVLKIVPVNLRAGARSP